MALVIRPLRFALPVGRDRRVNVEIGFVLAPILAVLLLLATTALPPIIAWQGIIGSSSSLVPYSIIIREFCLFVFGKTEKLINTHKTRSVLLVELSVCVGRRHGLVGCNCNVLCAKSRHVWASTVFCRVLRFVCVGAFVALHCFFKKRNSRAQ